MVAAAKLKQQFELHGLRAPDLTVPRVVAAVLDWDGDFKHLDVLAAHNAKAIEFRQFQAPKATQAIAGDPELKALDEKARLFTSPQQ
jgi:hypothetical protein